MSNTHSEIVGTGRLIPSGVVGEVGSLDLWGNKVLAKDELKGKITVEYGEVVLKDGTIMELSFRDYTALMAMIDVGSGGIFRYGTDGAIDTVMIGRVSSKQRREDAPIQLNEETRDKHLKQRYITHYKAETNWNGKGWQWQDISVEDAERVSKALVNNKDNIRTKVRQLVPQHAMKYVTEQVDGKELRKERNIDHHYPDVPMERINEYGETVVCWYWAEVYDDKERQKGKIGFKKVIEFAYNETKGDYEKLPQTDACTPEQVAQLDRRGY